MLFNSASAALDVQYCLNSIEQFNVLPSTQSAVHNPHYALAAVTIPFGSVDPAELADSLRRRTRFNKRLFERTLSELLLCQWNVRGLTPEVKVHLNRMVLCRKPDAFLLSELYTQWDAAQSDFDWDNMRHYEIYMQPHGFGKVATLVRNDLGQRQVDVEPACNAEIDQKMETFFPAHSQLSSFAVQIEF